MDGWAKLVLWLTSILHMLEVTPLRLYLTLLRGASGQWFSTSNSDFNKAEVYHSFAQRSWLQWHHWDHLARPGLIEQLAERSNSGFYGWYSAGLLSMHTLCTFTVLQRLWGLESFGTMLLRLLCGKALANGLLFNRQEEG